MKKGVLILVLGLLAAAAAYDHLAGKTVPKEIKVPVKLVTKANAQDFLKY